MEVIAGLSLAANIFQVVDFSHRMVSGALDSYNYGTSNNLDALEKVARELRSANRLLGDTLNTAQTPAPVSDDQVCIGTESYTESRW